MLHLTRAQNLFKKFSAGAEPPKAFFDVLGQNRDYNVDLIPKFIMANGARRSALELPALHVAATTVRVHALAPRPHTVSQAIL